ncbi:MAG: HIT domain-containing protein [Verrucomicrobia bacterium]|nr:HIT domain-containing protein [Verrucomicrobiota bacterium]
MNDHGNCCLCSQIAGQRDNDLISRMLGEPNYVRRVAMETDYFVAIPSLGPLVAGHTLLCPKVHIKNLACLAEDLRAEFEDFKKSLSNVLGSVFHAPIHYFEHGSPPESPRVLCTVDHAHLHLVPAEVKVSELLLQGMNWERIDEGLANLQSAVTAEEYLYYESPSSEAFISRAGSCESQYMRRVFSQALGRIDEWNWRTNPRPGQVDQTFRVISEACRRA